MRSSCSATVDTAPRARSGPRAAGAPAGRLAADRDTTLQALLGEAVNDLFAKHGLPELVERD